MTLQPSLSFNVLQQATIRSSYPLRVHLACLKSTASINSKVTSIALGWHTWHVDPFQFGPQGPLTSFIVNTVSRLSWEIVKHYHIGCQSRHNSQSTEERLCGRQAGLRKIRWPGCCPSFKDEMRKLYKSMPDFYFVFETFFSRISNVVILRIMVTVL